MMLGKRGRPPMRRTTSMTGITVDLGTGSEQEPSDYKPKATMQVDEIKGGYDQYATMQVDEIKGGYDQYSVPAMVSPRYQRKISGEGFQRETANFLRTCCLCNRRLALGRDIYMYRGDTAFCSMECREQQMKQDERKDKSNINPINARKTENHHNHSEFPSAKSETSSNNDTVAAA